jgi:hypothetical protein
MMQIIRRSWMLGAALGLAPLAAGGQGNLSTQGFGYPLGGLSTRAVASGGASGEFDPRSSRNPAAISAWLRAGVFFQYDPEFRHVALGELEDKTVTARFAAIGAAFPVKSRGMLGLSTHSFLDRTWSTTIRSGERLGTDSVLFTETNGSSGAINDTRLSFAYLLGTKVSIGAAVHLFTGENRLQLRRQFDDSLRYGTLDRSLILAYSGTGVSAGIVVQPVSWFSAAASTRRGGTMKLRIVDTLRTEASVPDRFGFAARLDAIPGVSLLASADRTNWSKLNGLGTDNATAQDAWEYAVGAELSAQRARITNWIYSVGFRTRELPFAAAGRQVTERALTGGVSAPLAGSRATVDLALQRATRDAGSSVQERAWLLSLGLTVRP